MTESEEIERLRNNHKDVVETKRRTNVRLRIALAGLQQAYTVCRDNEPESCDARMALAFVCEVVGSAFNAATKAHILRTHCSKGHSYTKKNTYWASLKNGKKYRRCRTCHCEHVKRLYRKSEIYREASKTRSRQQTQRLQCEVIS